MCGAAGVAFTSSTAKGAKGEQLEEMNCQKCGAGGARIAPARPSSGEYQLRYVAYARQQGREPDEQLAHDETAWPGGRMAGFIIWISKRWRQWDSERRQGPDHVRSPQEHNEFTVWLHATIDATCCAFCDRVFDGNTVPEHQEGDDFWCSSRCRDASKSGAVHT